MGSFSIKKRENTEQQKDTGAFSVRKRSNTRSVERADELDKMNTTSASRLAGTQYGVGNIDLWNRPQYKMPDGSTATVRSVSFYDDRNGKEVLVPSIANVNGKPTLLSDDEAWKRYEETGEYLGVFDTPEQADRYANRLHEEQEKFYSNPALVQAALEMERADELDKKNTPSFSRQIRAISDTLPQQTGSRDEQRGDLSSISRAGAMALTAADTLLRKADDALTDPRLKNAQANLATYTVKRDASTTAEERARWQRLADSAQAQIDAYSGESQGNRNLNDVRSKLYQAASEASYETRARRAVEQAEKRGNASYDDTFGGLLGSNYDVGRLSQDSNYAWNEYINDPSPKNRQIAELYDAAIARTSERNAAALAPDGAIETWARSAANYAPQFIDQSKARVEGGIAGSLIGLTGAGQAAGSAVDMYAITRGAAFKGLLEAGVPEEQAMAMAKDEALISSIIEYADALGEYAFLGGKQIVKLLMGGGAELAKTTAGKAAGKAAAKMLAAYGLNVLQEGEEERSQEAVSIANERRLASGTTDSGKLGLARDALGVYVNEGLLGEDSVDKQRMSEAAGEGRRIAAMFGALQAGSGLTANLLNNRQSVGTQARQETQPVAPTAQPVAAQAEPVEERTGNLTPAANEAAETQKTGDLIAKETRGLSDEAISKEIRSAVKSAATLGRNGAKAFEAAYTPEVAERVPSGEAFDGFAKVYNAALNGKTIPDVNIPDTLRIAAESSGKRDAQDAAQKRYFGEAAGLAADRSMRPRNLSARDARILDAIGKTAGVQIKFADHIGGVDERGTFSANAKIDNGVLTIARDADDPIKAAFTHETIHRLRETAPEAYTAMARFVLENMSDERFDSALREHMKRYGSENVSDMTEETVADAFGTVLDNPDLLERAVGIDRTFGQKLLDAVQEIIARIKRALGAKEARLSPEQVEAFRELQGKAEDMAKLLGDALDKVQSKRNDETNTLSGATTAQEAEAQEIKYSRVTDKDTLDWLNNQSTRKAYRAMQVIDGKLYPPMAAKVADEAGGKRQLVEPTEIGAWYRSDERPDLVDPKTGKFKLDKANGATIEAAYNPYFHTSATPLNDQFSSAYKRPNLVTVEVEIPESEMTSGYRAQYAKDSVGETKWHSGPVASQLKGEKARRVFLSRWAKVLRIVPDAEVASVVAKTLEGENVAVPYKVVTPSLRAELEKAGVSIDTTGEKTRYSRKIDADYMAAVERGDMDEAQRMVNDAAEAAGYTTKVYRGGGEKHNVFDTNRGDGTTQYGPGTYFTDGYGLAQDWAKERAHTENEDGYVGAFFLDDSDYFDDVSPKTDTAQWNKVEETLRNLGVSEPIIKYAKNFGFNGIAVALQRVGEIQGGVFAAYDWKNATKVNRILRDAGYKGIIGGFYDSKQYVAFSPEQVKSADPVTYDDNGNVIPLSQRFNKKNHDIRFSLKRPVEETDRFIALHNMSAEAMRGALELGGMAMPSVAMVPSTTGHDTYGEISAVFRKESVSPTDRRNKIFSGDAYTPTFPEVGIKISEKAADKAEKKVKALLKDAGVEGEFSVALDTDNLRDQIRRKDTFEKAYSQNRALQLAFLKDTGKQISVPWKEKAYSKIVDNATLKRIAQQIDVNEAFRSGDQMQYEPILRKLVREYTAKKYASLDEEKAKKIVNMLYPADKELPFNRVDNLIYDARKMQHEGKTQTVDTAKLDERLNTALKSKARQAEYQAWLHELGKDLIEKRGVRNDKDLYTPSGNRRSFEQLYYDYTLANIVKAMQSEAQQGVVHGFATGGSVRGASAKSYSSIEDARKDIGRVKGTANIDADINEKSKEFDNKVLELCNRLYDDPFVASEVLTETLAKHKTAESIYRYLKREYGGISDYHITQSIAEDAAELIKEAQKLPVGYLEAKLYRAVPLDEPIAYVVPRNIDKELLQQMRDAGLNVITYKPGDSADRLKKVNSVDGARFSRRRESGADQTEARLMRENDRLREQIAYLKAQTKRTPEESVGKVAEKDVRKVAAELVEAYGSTVSAKDIAPELQLLYDLMGTGRNENGELSYDAAREIANSVARKIAESAIDDTESAYGNYADLRKFLRETPITVSQSDTAEVDDWGDWRKRNMGRLNVRRGDTSNIDVIYDELSDRWPEFFPSDEISAGDQLQRMADVMDYVYSNRGSNPFDPYMEQAVIDIGNDVIERFFSLPQAKTFADKQAAKLEGMRVKMSEMRRESNERLRESLAKARENRDAKLAKQAERFRAKTEEGREKQNARQLRNKIARHTAALSQKLLRPSDKQHIPEALRSTVATMLEAVNKESAYDYQENPDGKRVRVPRGEGTETKRTEAFAALKKLYASMKDDANAVIDPDLFGDQESGFEGLFDQVIGMAGTPIQSMNAEQLQTIWRVVRAVEHSVNNYGKMMSKAKYATTADFARQFFSDTSTRRDRRSILGKDYALGLENPYTFFSQYGESGKAIYRMLRNAQDQQRLRLDQIVEATHNIVDGKTVDELRKERHEFTTERGEKLTLTTGQIMELYNLAKREQAHDHLIKGGIVQPEIEKNGKAKRIERGSEMILLTENDIANIVDTLEPEQIKIADALQQLTVTTLAEWGNEASMKAYGYKKFTGKDYWPIHSAKEALHSNVEKSSGNARSIKNIGMAKAVIPHASNALSIGDVFDTFAEHTADMVDYATWLLPMEDANRLFNYQIRNEDGTVKRTFQQELNRVGGQNGKAAKYWTDLMADIQNGIDKKGRTDAEATVARIVGNTKGASVGANFRVVAQQPTAFLRANAVVDPSSLSKGLVGGVTRGNGWKKAMEYAPIARIKDVGGFDQSNMRSVAAELYGDNRLMQRVSDAAGWGASKADAVTWGKLWNAAEWETKRLHSDIAVGSPAFYQKAAEIFTDVIDQTQVVDGILQRSAIMRSGNGLTQQATSFMGEPLMGLNMMLRAWDDVRYESDAKKRSAAVKALGRSVVALVVTDVVNSMVQSLVDAYRADDKDKDYWERFMEKLTGLTGDEETLSDYLNNVYLGSNLSDNMSLAGRIPYVKDIKSMMQGYTVERLDASTISDLLQAHKQMMTGRLTPAYGLTREAAVAAKILGVPAYNLMRDAEGVGRSVVYSTGDPMAIYKMEKSLYNVRSDKNKQRFYDSLYAAMVQGDREDYEAIRDDLMNEMGLDGKTITDAMKSRYNKAVKNGESVQLDPYFTDMLNVREKYTEPKEKEETFDSGDLDGVNYRKYVNQLTETYDDLSAYLKSTEEFKAFTPEEKDAALNTMYKYANDTALAANSDGKFQLSDKWEQQAQTAAQYGIGTRDYLMWYVMQKNTSSTRDANGKEVKGQKRQDKLRDWLESERGLTDGQKEWLWGTVYTSEW